MSYVKVPLIRGFTEVRPLFDLCEKYNAVICGGYARYCASPRPTPKVILASDADLFPRSEEVHVKLCDDLQFMGFEIKHENHISVTFKPTKKRRKALQSIPTPQVIKPIIEGKVVTLGSTEEILNNFDFTIVRAAIISATECLVDEDFLLDEERGVLKLRNIHCPISSTLRCCKYSRKGYFLRPTEALKLFLDWNDRGPEYQARITQLFVESAKGKQSADNPGGMTQKEIDELEALLRID